MSPGSVTATVPQPLPFYRARIEAAWVDYNGHLRDAYYALIVSHAIDDVMDHLGLDAAYRLRTRCTLYTLESHFHYLHEVKGSDEVNVESLVLAADNKRIRLGCRLTCGSRVEPCATADVLLLHVQQGTVPKSAPFPAALEARLHTLTLPTEAAASWGPKSRQIEIKRRPSV